MSKTARINTVITKKLPKHLRQVVDKLESLGFTVQLYKTTPGYGYTFANLIEGDVTVKEGCLVRDLVPFLQGYEYGMLRTCEVPQDADLKQLPRFLS